MVKFYIPTIDDLWFKEKLLSDKETMSYNHAYGGTITFLKENWESWHNKWITHPDKKRFFRYILDTDMNRFVGEAAYHYDENRKMYIISIIVYALFRHKGYGEKALDLLCDEAKSQGITTLYDDIAIDNPSIHLFLKKGFREVLRTNEYILVKKELTDENLDEVLV